MSKLSYYHADFSRKVNISKNRSFFKMAVTFDLNKIFQLCFDILQVNRTLLNINYVFLYEYKDLIQNGASKMTKFSFLARQKFW